MKPVDVITEIDIDRPVDVVAAYATDPDNAPTWYANIDSVEWRSDPPLRVGSVVGFVARLLGRHTHGRVWERRDCRGRRGVS